MVLMGLISGLLTWGLLGLSFWVAMLVGTTVTSTDPIVATTIVTGPVAQKNIPGRIRHFISAESGANDGAVYPLVLLPMLLLNRPAGEALARWITYVGIFYIRSVRRMCCTPFCEERPMMRPVTEKTIIRVEKSTKERLKEHGDIGMSYDDAVNNVLDRLEQLEEEHGAQ